MKARKPNFRLGQKVRSSFDPKHVFEIDASVIPDRLFHEKGTDRWWQRHEIRLLGAPEKALKPSLRSASQTHGKTHSPKVKEMLAGQLRRYVPKTPDVELPCEECGTPFKPKRKWQKFDKEVCRRKNWERKQGDGSAR